MVQRCCANGLIRTDHLRNAERDPRPKNRETMQLNASKRSGALVRSFPAEDYRNLRHTADRDCSGRSSMQIGTMPR